MPINKLLKNLLVEIVLCFTIATLAGHLSISFWERYVVHNELSNMKNNLYRLKVTVNHIGNAYDNLQNEIIGLAEIREPKRRLPRHDVKFSHRDMDVDTAKTLHYEIIKEVNNDKNWKPNDDRDTETMSDSYNEIKNNEVRNASTITNNLSKITNVESDSNQEMYSKSRYSCKLKDMEERHEYYKTCGCYFE